MQTKNTLLLAVAAGALGVAALAIFASRKPASVLQDERPNSVAARPADDQTKALEDKLRKAEARAKEAEQDVERLLSAVSSGRASEIATAVTVPPAAPGDFQGQLTRARTLAKSRNYKEALAQYLACFEESEADQNFRGVRRSFLLSDVARMGKTYPEAMAALDTLRLKTEQRLTADPSNPALTLDYTSLNYALGDEKRNLSYYDQLSANDPRRPQLSALLYDSLVSAQRYGDAASGRSYQNLVSAFEKQTEPASAAKAGTGDPAAARARAVVNAATTVEVLAGSGDIARAQQFMTKILAVDSTPATLQLLREHLTRAGRPDLAPRTQNPGN